ncbi:BEN domain-containing protein 5-like [Ornithodoros turicata]|uniref:BEN domain-containing protein 5-like n=1 Tax=Ornithodoros turicata TaxID=34597 RepID=UPI003138FF57
MTAAYVKYHHCGKRDVVDVSQILDFEPKHAADFNARHLYKIWWEPKEDDVYLGEPGYYKGQVLLLAASEKELQQKIAKKRIPTPKVVDIVSDSGCEDKQATDKRKAIKSQATSVIREITKQKLQERREHPLINSEDSDDDGAVVPQRIYDELKERYESLKCQLRELKSKPDSSQVQQESTIVHLNTIHGILQRIEEKLEQDRRVSSEGASAEPCVKKAKFTTDGSNVTINDTVTLPLYQWLHCQREKKESLFVRGMALALWDKETLQNRSTEGKVSNRFRKSPDATAKPQLSPEKMAVLEDCFEDWLVDHGASGPCLKERLGSLKGHLIATLRDAAKAPKLRDLASASLDTTAEKVYPDVE